MSTAESKVKARVVKILKELGAYYFFPATGGYGRSGVPDIVGCYRGKFFAIECKAKGKSTTALQYAELHKVWNVGGCAFVAREDGDFEAFTRTTLQLL